jgi:hypothetical protein
VEQEVINEFRKKFPFVRIEMIRAPGGQLITRVKTEARPASWRPTSCCTPTAG